MTSRFKAAILEPRCLASSTMRQCRSRHEHFAVNAGGRRLTAAVPENAVPGAVSDDFLLTLTDKPLAFVQDACTSRAAEQLSL